MSYIINNKKAQGEVITVILIILLVLAAIVIVWQVIQGTVEKGGTEIQSQTECVGLKVDITSIVTSNLAGPLTTDGSVTIRPNKDLTAYRVYVEGTLSATGPAVSAFNTDTVTTGPIATGNEIEVFGEINNKVCEIGSDKEIAK